MTSPWWYRNRFFTIGATYAGGFFFGPLVTGLLGLDVRPLFMLAGGAAAPARHAVLGVAAILAVACWAVRVWGSAYLRPEVVWNADALDDRLIIAGPFRILRNPLYFGNLLLALAMCAFAVPLGAAVVLAGNLLVSIGLIHVEEKLLRARYGAAFEVYAKAVPALVPRPAPYAPPAAGSGAAAAAVAPSFINGARSEIFTALAAVAVCALAAYLW